MKQPLESLAAGESQESIVPALLQEQEGLRIRALPAKGEPTQLDLADSYESLLELFEMQVAKRPQQPAIARETSSISYRELDVLTNQLARDIDKRVLSHPVAIGLYLTDSWDLIVTALAIWKTGSYYVHLDPTEPVSRTQFILNDANIVLVITNESLKNDWNSLNRDVPSIDIGAITEGNPIEYKRKPLTFVSLADVTYTSGSTGQPKGVLHHHGQLLDDAVTSNDFFNFGPQDRFLHLVLGMETYSSIATGATMVPFSLKESDSIDLIRVLQQEEITSIRIKPSTFRQLLDVADDSTTFESLRFLHLTGEPVFHADIEACKKLCPQHGYIVCNYGSQEMVNVSFFLVGQHTKLLDEMVPAGFPMKGRRIHILDEDGKPAAENEVGEICVTTNALSPGYLNLPELTAEKFLEENGERTFVTGDLGCLSKEGCLTVIGRKDNRQKVRGYTVEPGEVEIALQNLGWFRQTVVSGHTDRAGNNQLVAYLILSGTKKPSASTLRRKLLEKLPSYMIPSFFEYPESMPLLPSGKIDRNSLPAPIGVRPELDVPYAKASSEEESFLVGLWEDVLGISPVGIHDNFFELGGDSIKVMSLTNRIWKEKNIRVEASAAFAHPTVHSLAGIVDKKVITSIEPVWIRDESQPPPLSFGQERMWFLQQLEADSTVYIGLELFYINGPLNISRLDKSLCDIVSRHAVMRSRIVQKEGNPVQILDSPPTSILEIRERSEFAQRSIQLTLSSLNNELGSQLLNMEEQHPWRFVLLMMDADEYCLVTARHHIASDGWSEYIFRRELSHAYNARSKGLPFQLASLELEYADYASWQRKQLANGVYDDQLRYWKKELQGLKTLLLPTDKPRTDNVSFESDSVTQYFPEELRSKLQSLVKLQGCTMFTLLLAVPRQN